MTARLSSDLKMSNDESRKAMQDNMDRWDTCNEVFFGSQRDFKNFPTPSVPEKCEKVRLGLVPETWFTAVYEKTGVTGLRAVQLTNLSVLSITMYFYIADCMVLELLMGFHDVAFLSSRASFSTTFLTNCGSGERLWTTTCLTTGVGGKQGHAPCKMLSLQQNLFLC